MKNKQILIGLAFVVIGALAGFGFASRYYHVGPLAGLSGVPTKADFEGDLPAWFAEATATCKAEGGKYGSWGGVEDMFGNTIGYRCEEYNVSHRLHYINPEPPLLD